MLEFPDYNMLCKLIVTEESRYLTIDLLSYRVKFYMCSPLDSNLFEWVVLGLNPRLRGSTRIFSWIPPGPQLSAEVHFGKPGNTVCYKPKKSIRVQLTH